MTRAIVQALKNMRRAPYQVLAATLLVFITFFVGFALVLFLVGSQRLLSYFETRPQVTAFFDQDIEESTLQTYVTELENKEYVRDVRLITQEEALEIYRQQAGEDPVLLELVTADILPPSIEVSTVNLDELPQAAEDLQGLTGIDEVVYQKDVIDSLRYWTNLLRRIGIGILAIFTAVAVLVITIITSIRVASRKNEIRIMRLMGATKWHIQQPFLMEGVLYGLLGAILAWSSAYLVLLYSTPTLQKLFSEVQLVPVPVASMLLLLAGGLGIGLTLGLVASFLSARRLLRV